MAQKTLKASAVNGNESLRLATADSKLMEKLRKSRNNGEISASEYAKGSMYASFYLGSDKEKQDRAEKMRRSIEKGLLKDNLSYDEYKNLGVYIRHLDKRLSIPKHQRKSSAASQEKSLSVSRNIDGPKNLAGNSGHL